MKRTSQEEGLAPAAEVSVLFFVPFVALFRFALEDEAGPVVGR